MLLYAVLPRQRCLPVPGQLLDGSLVVERRLLVDAVLHPLLNTADVKHRVAAIAAPNLSINQTTVKIYEHDKLMPMCISTMNNRR